MTELRILITWLRAIGIVDCPYNCDKQRLVVSAKAASTNQWGGALVQCGSMVSGSLHDAVWIQKRSSASAEGYRQTGCLARFTVPFLVGLLLSSRLSKRRSYVARPPETQLRSNQFKFTADFRTRCYIGIQAIDLQHFVAARGLACGYPPCCVMEFMQDSWRSGCQSPCKDESHAMHVCACLMNIVSKAVCQHILDVARCSTCRARILQSDLSNLFHGFEWAQRFAAADATDLDGFMNVKGMTKPSHVEQAEHLLHQLCSGNWSDERLTEISLHMLEDCRNHAPVAARVIAQIAGSPDYQVPAPEQLGWESVLATGGNLGKRILLYASPSAAQRAGAVLMTTHNTFEKGPSTAAEWKEICPPVSEAIQGLNVALA